MAALPPAFFILSAPTPRELPADAGREIAFAGRSNAGKSTVINALTGQKGLARTSRTPGRTQLINLFGLGDDSQRLVDLPGYGYAKVPEAMRVRWGEALAAYFAERQSLAGVVVIMDIRHPLKETDRQMLAYALDRELPVLALLNKADKLSQNEISKTVFALKRDPALTQVQWLPFSGLSGLGVPTVRDWLLTRLTAAAVSE
ncbi:ribosome biogenesis GTP-binding protein YihA/YsxC [Halothiobacillus sp. DCM-1]|uniref:ribosome biogenesis GTP-binding protein YihA/YsxC n=1 Tax=Halothiobacillus sp. DCM-1 TaxID=3112558 RepID=UPI00388FA4ED